MGTTRTILIATLWSLLLAPTACITGALDHFCQSCPETPCQHEIDCSTDPCNVNLVLTTDSRCKNDPSQDLAPDLPVLAEFGGMAPLSGEAAPCAADPRVLLPKPLPASFPPLLC